jgi:hypothetical protein
VFLGEVLHCRGIGVSIEQIEGVVLDHVIHERVRIGTRRRIVSTQRRRTGLGSSRLDAGTVEDFDQFSRYDLYRIDGWSFLLFMALPHLIALSAKLDVVIDELVYSWVRRHLAVRFWHGLLLVLQFLSGLGNYLACVVCF